MHQPFGHSRNGPKIGSGAPLPFGGGGAGSHLTQCGQGQSLPACQVSSRSVQPFGHNTQTLQTGQTERQDRPADRQTDNGPIALGELFYKLSPKNGQTDRFAVWVVDWGGPMHKFSRIRQVAPKCHIMGRHVSATWRIQLNCPSVIYAFYVKLL